MSSDLPISSPYRSTPEAPVSDAERDQLTGRLNAAFEAGSLEQDDYRQRLDALFAAQRMGELVPVVTGLPPLSTYNSPAIVASSGGQPGELAPSRDSRSAALLVLGVVAGLIVVLTILLTIVF